MLELNREEFLNTLEEVSPGLSRTGIQDQSVCFIFRKGLVCAYNEEVFCSGVSKLPKDFSGAVPAKKLLELLRKMTVATVKLDVGDKKFTLIGKNEKANLRMESSILLPVDVVEVPEKDAWTKIHPDFTDAISIVSECASKNQELVTCTCVHLHPKWMEAFDNAQMTRYKIKTGLSKSFLVRSQSLKHVPAHDYVEFAETPKWIHFRTRSKSVLSCVRLVTEGDEFHNLTPYLSVRGTPTSLPKALAETADKAEIFTKDEGEDNMVLCEINDGKIQITGSGAAGDYTKIMQIRYKGPSVKFRVSPKLLIELLKRHTECEISDKNVLRVDGGKFVYCVCLEPC
jgi:hypothetical protein